MVPNSQGAKVLLAASLLVADGKTQFTAADLVVAAWNDDPATFGLAGYSDRHPDSNKVMACVMGEKGLVAAGVLAKVSPKVYSLTSRGRREVASLRGWQLSPADKPANLSLSPDTARFLERISSAEAYKLYRGDRKNEINFAAARAFWDIPESASGSSLDAMLAEFAEPIRMMCKVLIDAVTTLASGRSVSFADVDAALDLHVYLEERFSRHLNVMRHRAVAPPAKSKV